MDSASVALADTAVTSAVTGALAGFSGPSVTGRVTLDQFDPLNVIGLRNGPYQANPTGNPSRIDSRKGYSGTAVSARSDQHEKGFCNSAKLGIHASCCSLNIWLVD